MEVGKDLNIESLQDKETYDEKNNSSGFNFSVDVAQPKGKPATYENAGITGGANKGNTNSNYESVTDQAGIYAGKGGFDIEVGKNTDLKGAVIASEADASKNKLSTDTLTYSDIENKAEYSSSSSGINVDTRPNAKDKDKGITPNIGVTSSGEADSTTKSAIADGTIEIRSNPDQDLTGLSRDTQNALNELGKIFDKKKVEEQQELANLFGQIAFEEVHKISDAKGWDEGSPEKIALHALVGGIMSEITGSGFKSGAAGAGLNEALQKELSKIENPGLHQWASALVGTTAAKVVNGNAQAGASSAVSGTKNNNLYESIARTGIKLGILPDPNKMNNDYVYIELSGDVPLIGSVGGGYILDENGDLYKFSEKGWSLGLPIPIVFSSGIGNVDTTWKDGGGKIKDAIEGVSIGGGGCSLVSANASVGTNGALTFEVGIQTNAGVTVATRRAEWVGNIYQDN